MHLQKYRIASADATENVRIESIPRAYFSGVIKKFAPYVTSLSSGGAIVTFSKVAVSP